MQSVPVEGWQVSMRRDTHIVIDGPSTSDAQGGAGRASQLSSRECVSRSTHMSIPRARFFGK